ncbi:MAG: family transporter [Firmicutes bacterium]|nr:family transporter [Bacillota bacterium]
MLTDVYVLIVLMLSSFLHTITGFGFAIITAPLLALALEARETAMLIVTTSIIVMLFILRAAKNEGSFKAILPIVGAAIVGAIPGAYIVTVISNDGLKIFIGIVLIVAATAMWKDYSLQTKKQKFVLSIVGIISGFLSTTTGVSGPPVILYYLNAKAEENKDVFRGNLTRYFLLLNIVAIIISYASGNVQSGKLWLYTLLAVPALYIGFYLGERFFHRLNAELFKKISLAMVLFSSIAVVVSVLAKHLY